MGSLLLITLLLAILHSRIRTRKKREEQDGKAVSVKVDMKTVRLYPITEGCYYMRNGGSVIIKVGPDDFLEIPEKSVQIISGAEAVVETTTLKHHNKREAKKYIIRIPKREENW